MVENYSEYPLSVKEIKSSAAGDGSLWDGRDVLINVLRDVDKGLINPKTMVIIYEFEEEERVRLSYVQATKTSNSLIALAAKFFHMVMEDG